MAAENATRLKTADTAASQSGAALPCEYDLPDGRRVEIDYLDASDRADLVAGFEGLSPRSRYLRFFSAMPELPDFIATGLLATDQQNHVAIGARLIDEHGLQSPIIGVARYYRSDESDKVAEPAIAVADDLHHLGLGKRLLRRLSAIARANGVTHFRAQTLDSNSRMRRMLREADAEFVEQDGEVLTYQLDIRKSAHTPRGVLARLLTVMSGPSQSPGQRD